MLQTKKRETILANCWWNFSNRPTVCNLLPSFENSARWFRRYEIIYVDTTLKTTYRSARLYWNSLNFCRSATVTSNVCFGHRITSFNGSRHRRILPRSRCTASRTAWITRGIRSLQPVSTWMPTRGKRQHVSSHFLSYPNETIRFFGREWADISSLVLAIFSSSIR